MQRRIRFNRKRRIRGETNPGELALLAAQVKYGGNPEHKRNPGDFGLLPPAQPRAGKTLCDAAGITSRLEATRLLRQGVTKGLISVQTRGGFPQNIWAVAPDGTPLEAQLDNHVQGTYHGYPMPSTDVPLREEIMKRWKLP